MLRRFEGWVLSESLSDDGEQRAAIHEAAIIGFREVARAAVDDGDRAKAAEYKKLIEEYETQITILRRGGE